ncbi:MAG TPA: family 16 glycoside hydrolase [Steroidobacteraceae bacterium]|nr:family 16 glycoside hydrolase [Steroidobacteraceae bacterium]
MSHTGSRFHSSLLRLTIALLALSAGAGSRAGELPDAQLFKFANVDGIREHGVTVSTGEYRGRKALRVLQPERGDGFAVLTGTNFQDGVIEADMAIEITTPLFPGAPGFGGIAFRARDDVSGYELFYLRPGNSTAPDQAKRNHSVQYVAEPGFSWPLLRRAWPSVYEAYAPLTAGAWTHLKIEVTGRDAKLFINDAPQPALIVQGLKGEDLSGHVALWGFPGQTTWFSNVRITHAKPAAVRNGGEAAGQWRAKAVTDAVPMEGTLKLTRQGETLAGSWSGTFGDALPVKGRWRNGYVEIAFEGIFPANPAMGPAGPAAVTFAGWIDGDALNGRVRVANRAEGTVTLARIQIE